MSVHPLRSTDQSRLYPPPREDRADTVILLTAGFLTGALAATIWHTLTQRTTP